MSRVKHICYVKTKNNRKCRNRVSSYGERCHLHQSINLKHFYGFYPYPNYVLDTRMGNIDKTSDLTKDNIKLFKENKKIFTESDYELIIRNDGMVLVSIDEINQRIKDKYNLDYIYHSFTEEWDSYLEILNIIYLLYNVALQSNTCNMSYGIYEFYELKKHDIFRVTYEDGIAISSISYGNENKNRLVTYNKLKNIDKNDFRYVEFNERKFNFFNDYFKSVLLNEDLCNSLNIFSKSISEHLIHNFNNSFIMNWFYLESYYTNLWMEYIESINTEFSDGKKRFNRDRKKKIKNHSIASIIEQLEINNLITNDVYIELNELREVRNKIVHNLSYKCNNAQSSQIIKFISNLINHKFTLDWTFVNRSHGQHGL